MGTLDRYTCEQVFRRLDDYLDRELDAEEIERVEQHLATCEECASEYEFESAVLARMKEKMRRIQAPPSAIEAVRAVLRSHVEDAEEGEGDETD